MPSDEKTGGLAALLIVLPLQALLGYGLHTLDALLSQSGFHLVLGGLFLLYPALYMRFWHGFAAAVATGGFIHALLPPGAMAGALIFIVGWLVLVRLRPALRTSNGNHLIVAALAANGVVAVLLLASQGARFDWSQLYWQLAATQLGLSQAAAALLAIPFLRLLVWLAEAFGLRPVQAED